MTRKLRFSALALLVGLTRCATDADLGRNVPCTTGTRCVFPSGGTTCVDMERDPGHCGACNAACTPMETCAAGQCVRMRCARDAARCEGNDVLRCQSDGLTERRERCRTGQLCALTPAGEAACVLPAIAWPAASAYTMTRLRPALDADGWRHARGECGSNGPSSGGTGDPQWEIASDWGALWRNLESVRGFVSVHARVQAPEASANVFVTVFGVASGAMAEDFGGISLNFSGGMVQLSQPRDPGAVRRPASHTASHTLRVERDPSGTRVRAFVGDDPTPLFDGLLAPTVQGPAVAFRVLGSNCGHTNLRVEWVEIGTHP